MGRYLAYGVAKQIVISGKRDHNVLENKEQILKEVGKYIDLSYYQYIEKDDYMVFVINNDVVEDNIHDLIKEIEPVFHNTYHLDLFDIQDLNSFTKENFPLKIKKKDYGNGQVLINEKSGSYINIDIAPFQNYSYILLGDSQINRNIKIDIWFILIWMDWNKYDGESEYNMIRLLTIFSNNYFKNKLSKCSLFYIAG